MCRVTKTVGVVVAGAVMITAAVLAQSNSTPAVAPIEVVGSSGNMSPIISNLDEALHFYVDLLGYQMPRQPRKISHADVPYPVLLDNQGTPDATLRWVSIYVPGKWRLELLEFGDIERTPVAARPQDPGAMTLVLQVRDVDALLAKLKAAKVPVVTAGGQPVTLTSSAGKVRAVTVKDPVGHFVELEQPGQVPAGAPADGNILGSRVRITVADTDETLRLYRDKFGFKTKVGPFASDATRLRLMGLENAEFRITETAIPNVPDQVLEFIEFKGIDRKPLRGRISDPGSSRIQLRVRDLPTAIREFQAVGGVVTSTGGKSVMVDKIPSVIVRDMNNIFVIMQQPAAAPPATANR
jgi:catechol 2,3-dioxygenase-like lactoylglutathione lyase family enzyme